MARSQTRRLFDILVDGMWHVNGELAQQISSSKFGFCMRLTARVHDLRQLGFDIRCEAIDRRRGVFKYRMFTPRHRIDEANMRVISEISLDRTFNIAANRAIPVTDAEQPEITQQEINFYEEIIRKEGYR